jgi:phospholipase/carboxylesterase
MNLHNPADTLRLGAPLEQAHAAILLLHGRGSSAEEIAGLNSVFKAQGLAFLAPNATHHTWYPQRFLAPTAQNEPWLSSALEVIDLLVREVRTAGVTDERIGLVGFSQGACLALEYAARHPRRYGFIAGLSGALIGPLGEARPAFDLQSTPVLVGCAERDAHIPLEHVEASIRALQSSGANVERQIFPGSAHTVFPSEITWLASRFLDLPSR